MQQGDARMGASRIRPLFVIAVSLLVSSLVLPRTAPVTASTPGGGRYIVAFDGAVPGALASRVKAAGGRVVDVVEHGGFAVADGLTSSSAEGLRRLPGVSGIQSDIVVGPGPAGAGGVEAMAEPVPCDQPLKPCYGARQWNLDLIDAEVAWAQGYRGHRSVRVAILDTGIDYNHPDLEGRVDLSPSGSVSLLSASGDPCAPGSPSTTATEEIGWAQRDGFREFMDYHSHGTAVAGLVVSKGNWLAGVTEKTTLIAVKVHGRSRQNCLSVYLRGVIEAADRGADVIHLSFPLEFPRAGNDAAIRLINDTMAYAHGQGAVLVAAAGNQAQLVGPASPQFRFCGALHVFCISATAPTSAAGVNGPWTAPETSWPLTNFGPDIAVAGPGGSTASGANTSVWLLCSRVAVAPAGRPCTVNNVIWSSTGTSFGAAATSGLAALLVAIVGPGQPAEIERIIRSTATDVLIPPGVAGRDDYYGDGLINVGAAAAEAAAGEGS